MQGDPWIHPKLVTVLPRGSLYQTRIRDFRVVLSDLWKYLYFSLRRDPGQPGKDFIWEDIWEGLWTTGPIPEKSAKHLDTISEKAAQTHKRLFWICVVFEERLGRRERWDFRFGWVGQVLVLFFGFSLLKTTVFQFWCFARFGSFLQFSLWFLVFVNNNGSF